jgi:outer membrane biogenesis lipoprotein LolB
MMHSGNFDVPLNSLKALQDGIWTLAKKSESAPDAFERKVLRRILGPMRGSSTWRVRYDELYKQFEEPSTSNIIQLERQQWAGHIQRMDEKRIPKRILESNIVGKRPACKEGQGKDGLMQWK